MTVSPSLYFPRSKFQREARQVSDLNPIRRFIGSAIGWIWGLIHPLVLLLSWTFVFQVCLRQKVPAGEETTFSADQLMRLIALGTGGITEVSRLQKSVLGDAWPLR